MGKRDRIKRSPSHSNSKIPLSIKELKDFVDATSTAVGIGLSEDSVDGSVDEDQEKSFGAIKDSCEVAKARRSKEASTDAGQEAIDPNVDNDKEPSPSPFTDRSFLPSSSNQWCIDMQARLRSIKNRFPSTYEMSLNPIKDDSRPPVAALNTYPKEPSNFESFLMEELQAISTVSANVQHAPSSSPYISNHPIRSKDMQARPLSIKSRFTSNLEADNKQDPLSQGPSAPNSGIYAGEAAHKDGFDLDCPSIEDSEVLVRQNPHYSASFIALGSHYDRLGHVEAPGKLTVENSRSVGPTGMMVVGGPTSRSVENAAAMTRDAVDDQYAIAEKDNIIDIQTSNGLHVVGSSGAVRHHDEVGPMRVTTFRAAADRVVHQLDFPLSSADSGAQMPPTGHKQLPASPQIVGPTVTNSAGTFEGVDWSSITSGGAHLNSINPMLETHPKQHVHNCVVGSPTLSTSDLGQAHSHGAHSNDKIDSAARKKFSDLFGSVPEYSKSGEIPGGKSGPYDFPLDFVYHGTRSENLTLKVPKDLSVEGCSDWATTLVGYFIGRGLPYSLVTSSTERLWADFGLSDTLATDSGVFFFTFSCEANRDAVLEGGPWYVAGQPIILQPWKPSFKLDKKDVRSLPLWVNLYGIPLELWNPKGISFIASYIGKPLRVDRMTASRRRISYARVCVEVSGDLDLIDKFSIETEDGDGHTTIIDIDVEYQWKPSQCSNCSMFGHDCNKVAHVGPGQVAQRSQTSQAGHPKAKAGEWQVVNRRDKGKHKALHPNPKDVVPTGGPNKDSNMFSALSQINDFSEQDAYGSEAAHHLEFHLRASSSNQAQPNYPLTGPIPYVYDTRDSDCSGNLPGKESNEVEEANVDPKEIEAEAASVRPISARQKKKEAKMLFSGSRPKGRH